MNKIVLNFLFELKFKENGGNLCSFESYKLKVKVKELIVICGLLILKNIYIKEDKKLVKDFEIFE